MREQRGAAVVMCLRLEEENIQIEALVVRKSRGKLYQQKCTVYHTIFKQHDGLLVFELAYSVCSVTVHFRLIYL